jgi:propionate CoA-transferase
VFRLGKSGVALVEVAPGIDLERDIFAHMDFRPPVSHPLKLMDKCIFLDEKMGLSVYLQSRQACNVPTRLRENN